MKSFVPVAAAFICLSAATLPAAPRPPQIIVDAGGNGDYTTIEAAVAAAPAGGAQILVKRGTYALGATLTLGKTNLQLVGEDKYATRILQAVGADGIYVTANNVTIENLEFDGQRSLQPNNPGAGNGINVYGANCTIRNCFIHNTRGKGIFANSAAPDLLIEANNVENGGTTKDPSTWYDYGIFCQVVTRPVIRGNFVRGWSEGIGLWWGCVDGLVADNKVINNYAYIYGGGKRSACEDYGAGTDSNQRNRWINNVIDGSTSYGLEIATGGTGLQFIGNTCRNCTDGQFAAFGVPGQEQRDLLVADNHFEGPGQCLVVGSTYRARILRNTWRGDGTVTSVALQTAAAGGGTPDGLDISDNSFYNENYGVQLYANGDGVRITGNRFQNIKATAINIRAGGHHVIANNTASSINRGIWIEASSPGYSTSGGYTKITGNIFTTTGLPCDIRTADNFIEGNTFRDDGSTNICLWFWGTSALRNLVRGNTLGHNGGYWATIQAGADYNIVQDNQIVGGVLNDRVGAHNTLEPNHTTSVTKTSSVKLLGSVTVGTSQTAVIHGLDYVPSTVTITMTSPGSIYKSAPSDTNYIYLKADAPNRTAEIYAR